MPATSKAQFRFMAAVASGRANAGRGLSKSKAREFLHGVNYKSLPARRSTRGSGSMSRADLECGYKRYDGGPL